MMIVSVPMGQEEKGFWEAIILLSKMQVCALLFELNNTIKATTRKGNREDWNLRFEGDKNFSNGNIMFVLE